MTDYNDGKWHGWNGGECPVHPESEIELRNTYGRHVTNRLAGRTAWDDPLLFRVTKAYVEPPKPREYWIVIRDGDSYPIACMANKQAASAFADGLVNPLNVSVIHVIEKLP